MIAYIEDYKRQIESADEMSADRDMLLDLIRDLEDASNKLDVSIMSLIDFYKDSELDLTKINLVKTKALFELAISMINDANNLLKE